MRLQLATTVWVMSLLLVIGRAQDTSGPKPVGPERDRARESHQGGPLFADARDCLACHNNLTTPAGEDVSIGATWRSSMMANAARDPYWQATVRRETIDHPKHDSEIQDECAACHMPMLHKTVHASGGSATVFAHLPSARGSDPDLQRLASDGVSCTVCHQMAPDGLGTRDSFNGNFQLRPTQPDGTREIFGPFEVDRGRTTVMRSVTGFTQAEAPHIAKSELCASCHTLITQAFGPNGDVIGSLHEQMNYQEWQHSAFSREDRSCQSCHMPKAKGPVRVSSVLGEARDTLARHVFVGGNAYMIRILNRYRAELGVTASPAELNATADATVRQLQEDTATLHVSSPRLDAGMLAFDVDVRNLTGHKLPTGYPSRRVWLHITVTDARGVTVFESGALADTGAIQGNDSDRDPLTFEPHYEEITRPDEVQIYEPILGDRANVPTTGLLTATQYLKDSRLLPRGFDKKTAPAEIGVFGGAAGDPDFTDAGDRTRYRIAVPASGQYTVAAELRYQSIGYRWAHNLAAYDAPEPKRFVSYYTATSSASSVIIASARATTR